MTAEKGDVTKYAFYEHLERTPNHHDFEDGLGDFNSGMEKEDIFGTALSSENSVSKTKEVGRLQRRPNIWLSAVSDAGVKELIRHLVCQRQLQPRYATIN